jgi:hypothetical protein
VVSDPLTYQRGPKTRASGARVSTQASAPAVPTSAAPERGGVK